MCRVSMIDVINTKTEHRLMVNFVLCDRFSFDKDN